MATPTRTPTPTGTPTETPDWVAHRENGMHAVLHLPRSYRPLYRAEEEAPGPSRLAVYGDEAIRVRLAVWAKATRSPLAEAREDPGHRAGQTRSPGGRYVTTRFHGHEAALSDVTYDPRGRATRVLRLIVRTDDDRMYQLRVDMPKGTEAEEKGAALFQGARDRLEIGRD